MPGHNATLTSSSFVPAWAKAAVFCALFAVAACVANSKVYRPSSPAEQSFYAQSRADIFPDDVRKNFGAYTSQMVRWPGIVESVSPVSADAYMVIIAHHYWDWIEDNSIQKEKAFLSPRGEGKFACISTNKNLAVGNFVIAYGKPYNMQPDNVIAVTCEAMTVMPNDYYSTTIFDYGRGWLVNHDKADFKQLRVPF